MWFNCVHSARENINQILKIKSAIMILAKNLWRKIARTTTINPHSLHDIPKT